MFCFKCGGNIPETASVCPLCATPVQGAPQTASPVPQPSAQPGQPVSQWQSVPAMQPVQPQAPFGGAPARPYVPPQTDGKATGSLILGILSMVCLGILAGIPAIILGHMSRKSIRESMGRLKGEGQATAGMVMGYISVALIPVILIIAAIAIPSLLRSRMAANDAAAASTLRTVNTSQVAYLTQYPQAGYARDMASMGPGSVDCSIDVNHSSDHACLLSAPIASEQCIATNWCANKYGFQFAVTGICVENQPCSDYIATAVPLQMGASGTRSFCSTSDGVVRYKRSDPPAAPITSVEECNGWAPIS